MECVLLGTGSADGWPNPFCTCASCGSAVRTGDLRGQTSALVDDVLLLDCGPETPRAALRAGRHLAGVRHLLLTHAHPDHVGPAALLWRQWAGRGEPLDLVGPPSALDACRPWTASGDPVRPRAVGPGAVLRLGGYTVRVLDAAHDDDAVLYDVTGPDRSRLLYATDTGPLPGPTLDALAGASLDLVLLEETFGDVADHDTGHLDLATFPQQLAALRASGAIAPHTNVVAVHLGHHNPPTAELSRRLAAWGARVVPDGTVLPVDRGVRARRPGHLLVPRPRRTLVLGGARSGKSREAERLLSAEPVVTYVATGGPREGDPEWAARVAGHRARRPAGWETVECADVAPVLQRADSPVLVDCLTLWLARALDDAGAWGSDADTATVERAVQERLERLVAAWRTVRVPVVAVSNEVGSGVVPATASGRLFRDLMGHVNARIAAESEQVLLVVAGRVVAL